MIDLPIRNSSYDTLTQLLISSYAEGMTACEPEPPGLAPVHPAGAAAAAAPAAATSATEPDADRALTAMYGTHYRSIVRIAALLAGDVRAAEDIAQDSFVAMYDSWSKLRDYDKALSFLLQFVVSRSRLVLRQPPVPGPRTPGLPPDVPGGGPPEPSLVGSAIRALPHRQREALVLGFYLDLPDRQIAAAMRISRAAVKIHTARGIAALRGMLPT